MSMSMSRTRKRMLFVMAMFVLGSSIALVALDRLLDPFNDQAFEPELWASAELGGRVPMARGAIQRIRPGMQESDVVKLLGKPDTIEESQRLTKSAPSSAVKTYSYYLGSSGLTCLKGMDDAFVWVHVGLDGRVIKAVIGGG